MLWHYGVDGPLTNAIDFRAFYCAGAALDAGGDPYLEEPVRSCERASLRAAGFSFTERDVLVAPYPPLALAAFGLLARLPYRTAVELWLTLAFAALCLAIVLTARLARLRPLIVGLALVASVGFASFFLGQSVPLAVAGLVAAALSARTGPPWLTALGLVVASIQPHLALPAWIGAALLVPSARTAIAASLVALVGLSFAFFSRLTVEYVRVVLPLHSRAEVANFTDQYGLSALLHHYGVGVALALRLGSLSYVVSLAIGISVAARLVRRFDDRAFAILAPSAIITIGGPFVHGHQIAAALPFALLLLGNLRGSAFRIATIALGIAIVALAIPWNTIADQPGVDEFFPHQAYVRPAPFRIPSADELIDRGYIEREDALAESNERTPAVQLAWKLPTWCALVVLLFVSLAVARGPFRRNA
jgi:hypothetical protein